jgi:hypothetical protein
MPLPNGDPRGNGPRRAKAPVFTDKETPDFWRSLKSGDFVSINDTEAFEASLAEGKRSGGERSGGGLDYAVGDIRTFALLGPESKHGFGPRAPLGARGPLGAHAPLGEYRFIELQREGSGPLYLTLVDLPDSFELRLYFIPAGLEPGTRDEFIDRGQTWLFLPPSNPDDFISAELEYAPYPDVPEIEEGGESRKLLFSRVGPGSLYGEGRDTQASVIIVEYAAEAPEGAREPTNPLLLVLEEGWIKSDGSQPEEGGYLTVLLGKVMRTSDLDCYPS